MAGQQHRGNKREVIGVWMLFFLSCLEILIERLETKYALYQRKGGYLNERQQRVLAVLAETEPTRISDLARCLPAESVNTLKKDLRYLMDQGLIERLGELKASVYILKPNPDEKK